MNIPMALGISAGVDAFTGAYISNAQTEAKQMVDNAMAAYQETLRDKHNEAVNYAAGQSLNIASLNEMQINIEAVQRELELEKTAMVAEASVETQLNAIGAEGKTVDRLKKQVRDTAALEKSKINTDQNNQLLQSLFTRRSIEQNRLAQQDHSIHLRSSGGTVNPLVAGLATGLTSYGSAYAKLND